MDWVVKLTKKYGQYRITLPRKLVKECKMEEVEFIELRRGKDGWIIIGEYHGKGQEKRGVPKDQA